MPKQDRPSSPPPSDARPPRRPKPDGERPPRGPKPDGERPPRGPRPDGRTGGRPEGRPDGERPPRGPKPEGGRPPRGPRPDGERPPHRSPARAPSRDVLFEDDGPRPKRSKVGSRPDGERPQHKTSAEQWHGEITGSGESQTVKRLADALRCAGPVERATHRFHSYPARLHPDAAQRLLRMLPGEVILDPFCGGGTVLVEAMCAGRAVFGNDLSPVAAEVAWARTRRWDAAQLDALLAAARAVSEEAQSRCRRKRPAPIPPRVLDLRTWYAPQALGELGWLLALSQEVSQPDIRRMLRAVHSASVIKFSLRASDTSNKKVDVQRPPGSASRHFEAKTQELCGQLAAFATTAAAAPEPTITHGDILALSLPTPADVILTSPPYPGTYDYVELQQLRLAWYGWSDDKSQLAAAEIGSRRVFKQPPGEARAQWADQTHAWMRHAAQLLTPGGRICVVIGDGITRGRLIDTLQPSLAAAKACGLRPVAHASAERLDFATERTRREHAILWERPHP